MFEPTTIKGSARKPLLAQWLDGQPLVFQMEQTAGRGAYDRPYRWEGYAIGGRRAYTVDAGHGRRSQRVLAIEAILDLSLHRDNTWISARDKVEAALDAVIPAPTPDTITAEQALEWLYVAAKAVPAPRKRLDVGNEAQRRAGCVITVADWLQCEGCSIAVGSEEFQASAAAALGGKSGTHACRISGEAKAFVDASNTLADGIESLMLGILDGKATVTAPARLPEWFWRLLDRAKEVIL